MPPASPSLLHRAVGRARRVARRVAEPPRRKLPVWAVMVGAVRRPIEFKFTMLELLRLRREGALAGVILSTWIGELDAIVGLRADLLQSGVTIVESEAPADLGSWNIFAQHKAFLAGLDALPNTDVYVLKSRTDRAFELTWSFEPWLRAGLPEAQSAHGAPRVFEHKIICLRFSTTLPFYINDFTFLAHHNDCRRLINFDRFFDDFCTTHEMVPELRWFVPPFLRESRLLSQTFQYVPLVETSLALMSAAEPAPLPEPLCDILAFTLACIRGNMRTAFSTEPARRCASADVFRPVEVNTPGIETREGYFWSMLNSSSVLDAFVARRLRPSLPFDAISARMNDGVGLLQHKALSADDLASISAFSAAAIRRPTPRIDQTARPTALHTTFGLSTDLGLDANQAARAVPAIMRDAGGHGVGSALRTFATDHELSDAQRMRLLAAATELLDIDAALALAKHELRRRDGDWRGRAEDALATARRVATRSAPWRLPDVEEIATRVAAVR